MVSGMALSEVQHMIRGRLTKELGNSSLEAGVEYYLVDVGHCPYLPPYGLCPKVEHWVPKTRTKFEPNPKTFGKRVT